MIDALFRPSRLRACALGTLGGLVAMAAVLPHAAADTNQSPASELLAQARAQLSSTGFEGTVIVEWATSDGVERNQVEIHGVGGTIEVRDEQSLARTAITIDAESSFDVVPDPGEKYDLTLRSGPSILDRTTTLIEIRLPDDDRLLERIFVDDASGIMLRRERFAPDGSIVRAVSFVEFSLSDDPIDVPPIEPDESDPVGRLEGIYRDPASAGDRFELLSRTIDVEGNAHLLYGDGLLTVSVFEEPGALDWSAVPPGGVATRVDGVRALRYERPIGTTYLWERGGVVYTAVSDAPESQILGVAESVSTGRESNVVARLARTSLDVFAL